MSSVKKGGICGATLFIARYCAKAYRQKGYGGHGEFRFKVWAQNVCYTEYKLIIVREKYSI